MWKPPNGQTVRAESSSPSLSSKIDMAMCQHANTPKWSPRIVELPENMFRKPTIAYNSNHQSVPFSLVNMVSWSTW